MSHYQNYLLNKKEEYNHIDLNNLTREIFFITKTKDNTTNYIETKEIDTWYNEYNNSITNG